MNVFNKVNFKERTYDSGMYAEWSSISLDSGGQGVLGILGGPGGRDVVMAVVKQLTLQQESSPLVTDAEVEWVLEVIRYGLCLPLGSSGGGASGADAVRACVRVCCAWLQAMLPPAPPAQPPPPAVPLPVIADAPRYARIILSMLCNLFVPRPGEALPFIYRTEIGADLIGKQAVLCHRVLRLARTLASTSTRLGAEEWRSLLLLLLGAAAALLAPPAAPHEAADQLTHRVLSVLFEVWVLACHRCFPSPVLWRTFRERCMQWRHRPALTEQWARVSLCLTSRLTRHMYGPLFPHMPINEEDLNLIPADMSNEAVAQTWYRMLHTIGNPVDLCRPQTISQTPEFLQYAITQDNGGHDPSQHPCLLVLPVIFHKAMRGLAAHVDAFLGIGQAGWWEGLCETGDLPSSIGPGGDGIADPLTPPSHRRLAKSFSVSSPASSHNSQNGSTKMERQRLDKQSNAASGELKGLPRASLLALSSNRPISVVTTNPVNTLPIPSTINNLDRPPLASCRPSVNSILHLLGEWLFEAVLIGVTLPTSQAGIQQRNESTPPPSLTDLPLGLQMINYQPGRAEALGALCRIFCSKQSRETVLASYLARFYISVQKGLQDPTTASAIILNASDIFRLDLYGVLVLVPDFVTALERILPDRSAISVSSLVGSTSGSNQSLSGASIPSNISGGSTERRALRRAAASILLSLAALPHALRNLPVPDLPCSNERTGGVLLGSLAGRVSLLAVGGVQAETVPALVPALLSALFLCVRHAPMPPSNASIQDLKLPGQREAVQDYIAQSSTYPAPGRCETSSTSSSEGATTSDESLLTEALEVADNALLDLDPSSPLFGATLVVRATYLVCHRLISSWKSDLQVSLAALEFLESLAKLKVLHPASERARCVRWVCDYISLQCGRPPPAHSRDLHSGVVAAYACLAAWLTSRPYSDSATPDLLEDSACRAALLDVIELGISGTKSQVKPGDTMKMKDEKELKPVSMRVRDAAENLLMLIMEQVGVFPGLCGTAAGGWSLLDEATLARHCSAPFFRYFLLDDTIIMSILEEPLGNHEDPQPTITVLLRWAFGRHVWSLYHRSASRSTGIRRGTARSSGRASRPIPIQDAPAATPPTYVPLPHGPPTAADASFPSLETVLMQLNDPDAPKLFKLLEKQAELEKQVRENEANVEQEEYVPPQPVQEFQAARIFLSQFGFLDGANKNGRRRLHALLDGPGLEAALLRLDSCHGPRTHVTAHMFCARAGVRRVEDIVNAPHKATTVDPAFLRLLAGLGKPVKVHTHPGWCGRPVIPFAKPEEQSSQENEEPHGGALYDGRKEVLYWADATSEIAFIVPTDKDGTKRPDQPDDTASYDSSKATDTDGACFSSTRNPSDVSWESIGSVTGQPVLHGTTQPLHERSTSVSSNNGPPVENTRYSAFSERHRAFSLELDKTSPNASFNLTGSGRRSRQYTIKILIVWLEDFEDHLHISVDDLLKYTDTGEVWRRMDVCVLWCARLRSGLIRMASSGDNVAPAGPLAPGALIAPSALPDCIRQTLLNAARRRRLQDDSYHPPHVRRRHIIQEIAQQFKLDMSEPELLTSLFYAPDLKADTNRRE